MKSIKNVKKVVMILLAMLVCGNVLAAERRPDQIDVKISNFRQEGSNVKFSLKFKAGTGYPFGNFPWTTLNINLDIYNTDGALNTAATTNDGVALGTFGIYGSTTSYTDNPGTRPPGSVPLGIVLRRLWDDPRGDVGENYEIVANYTIPVSGTLNPNAYIIFRETTAVGGPWNDLDGGGWSSSRDSEIRTGAFKSHKAQYNLNPTCPAQALWTGAIDTDWHDADNWENPLDQSAVGVPCASTDVYIPGTVSRFPILKGMVRLPVNNPNVCKDITFFQGGQVGRIDLLTYQKARVQLNIQSPFYQSGYNTDFTNSFWNFSHYYSTPTLSRGQWHMITIPLKGVVSGDLAYGGYPMTFMRKFNTMKVNTGRFTEGDWSTSFTETNEPIGVGEGFAFYVYGGGTQGETQGFGRDFYSFTNEANYSGTYPTGGYGLGLTCGIMEFPTYDNASKLQSHRIQKYEGGVSTFYDVATNENGNIMLDSYSTKTRSADDYKFIADAGLPFTTAVVPANQDWTGGDMLIGNPFMSALDFDAFWTKYGTSGSYGLDNNSYRIWDGTEFVTYDCGTRLATKGTFTPYIAPMQAFFIYQMGYKLSFDFDAETMSKASPNPINLRSSVEKEQNIIRLSARNESGVITNTVIGQMENAEAGYNVREDITKLFAPSSSSTSEIYTLVGETALAMNYIGNAGAIVPVGVRVPASGTTTLRLTGMDNYNATKIELIDGITGATIWDITGLPEYELPFNNGEGGYQSGRFLLRIAESTTGMRDVTGNAIQVYESGETINVVSSSNDLIKQVHVYDIQGRILYSNTSVDNDIYQVKDRFERNQVLVVRVITENNSESVKLKN